MRQFLLGCALVCVTAVVHADPDPVPHDEEVTIRNGTISIACTLSLPGSARPAPAVMLLSGSGPQNRDSDLGGFRPFKLMADAFAARGIAVLRCDDRGVGGSSGSLADSTTEDFAGDALAAIETLRSRGEIDSTKIGLLGHSEGATVAAIAAARSKNVAFVVWMAGSAVSGLEILQTQAATIARAGGVAEPEVKTILEMHAALMKAISEDAPLETLKARTRTLAAAQLTSGGRPAPSTAELDQIVTQHLEMLRSPWMRFFVSFDPGSVLREVGCPIFAIFGGRDTQVPAELNSARLTAALAAGGNQPALVRVFPDANHLFMPAVTGHPAEYATLPKEFVPSFLDGIAEWVLKR